MAKFADSDALFPLADLRTRLGLDQDTATDALIEEARDAAVEFVGATTWRYPITQVEDTPRQVAFPGGQEPLLLPYSRSFTGPESVKGWSGEDYTVPPDVTVAIARTVRTAAGNLELYPAADWPSPCGEVVLKADWDFSVRERNTMRSAISLFLRGHFFGTTKIERDYSREAAEEVLVPISVRSV